MRKFALIFAFLLIFAFICLSLPSFADDKASGVNSALAKTHAKIIKDYKAVPHIKLAEMEVMDSDKYLIFDVREKDEFAVSHIKDAIWVDPAIDVASFYEKFEHQIEEKTVILYCSVGVRSTRLAEKLMMKLSRDNIRIYNLENGIFGWHNESRPLFKINEVRDSDMTDFVHPYNIFWKRMLNRKHLTRYK